MEAVRARDSSKTREDQPLPNHLFFALNLPAYVPGKRVDGVIVLVIQQHVRIQSLSVAWKGEERVQWYQGATQRDLCAAQRTLFEHTTPVSLTSKTDGSSTGHVLQPGTYTYNVVWDALPDDLPPSFEDEGDGVNSALPVLDSVSRLPRTLAAQRSHIRYAATALLEFSPVVGNDTAPPTDQQQLHRLTRQVVLRLVERVSTQSLLQAPLTRFIEQTFLLSSGVLRVDVTLGNGGVLFAGQALFVRLLVRNGSSRNVEGATLSLHEQTTLKAHDTSASNPDDLAFVHEFARRRHVLEAAVTQSAVPAGTAEWVRELLLPLPLSTPPTITSAAAHVRRVYELNVEFEVSLGSNVLVVLPVHVLAWSPLLSSDLPAKVPVSMDKQAPQ